MSIKCTEDKISFIRFVKPFWLCDYWRGHSKMVTTRDGRYISAHNDCVETYENHRDDLLKNFEMNKDEAIKQIDPFIKRFYN